MNEMTNPVIRCRWQVDAERLMAFAVENRFTGQTLSLQDGCLPRVVLGDGRAVAVASAPVRWESNALVATFHDDGAGLSVRWSATLDDGANAVIQSLQLTATRDTAIAERVFFDHYKS